MSMGVWKTWATVAAVAILLELMACTSDTAAHAVPDMLDAVREVKIPGPAVVAPMGGAVASAERSAMGVTTLLPAVPAIASADDARPDPPYVDAESVPVVTAVAVTVPNVGFVDIATYYDASIRFASAKKEAATKVY